MKTRLFTKSAIIMATAFSLASCSQEEELVNPTPDPKPNAGRTVFAAGGPTEDGTRTTMDNNRVYYWQYNDQIWVNDGGTWLKSSDSELAPDGKTANFYFNKVMTADSYDVLYTGYNSSSPTQVTFPNFNYVQASDAYIGNRGDCGVATATRNDNGTYSFALLHKASYLGIAPLRTGYFKSDYCYTKVEVVANSGSNNKYISGTYGFSSDGIDTTNVTAGFNTITLEKSPDKSYIARLQSYNSNYKYFYVSIPPVYRQLDVKYHFISTDNPEDTLTYTKRLQPRQWIANNVVQFRHDINTDYYCWDAPATEPYDGIGNKSNHNATDGDAVKATNVCATMPNPNEMLWYLYNGDPRWDDETEWTIDDGASYHTGGVWILKKAYIDGFSETAAPDGSDYRTPHGELYKSNFSDSYRFGGKPASTARYFFLPALGGYGTNSLTKSLGETGEYWSSYSSSNNSSNRPRAYFLSFSNNSIFLNCIFRSQAKVAGNGWFK